MNDMRYQAQVLSHSVVVMIREVPSSFRSLEWAVGIFRLLIVLKEMLPEFWDFSKKKLALGRSDPSLINCPLFRVHDLRLCFGTTYIMWTTCYLCIFSSGSWLILILSVKEQTVYQKQSFLLNTDSHWLILIFLPIPHTTLQGRGFLGNSMGIYCFCFFLTFRSWELEGVTSIIPSQGRLKSVLPWSSQNDQCHVAEHLI